MDLSSGYSTRYLTTCDVCALKIITALHSSVSMARFIDSCDTYVMHGYINTRYYQVQVDAKQYVKHELKWKVTNDSRRKIIKLLKHYFQILV